MDVLRHITRDVVVATVTLAIVVAAAAIAVSGALAIAVVIVAGWLAVAILPLAIIHLEEQDEPALRHR